MNEINPSVIQKDILRFFDNCPQYTEAMNNGTISDKEYQKYAAKQFPGIATKVANVFHSSFSLLFIIVILIILYF